MQSPSVIRTNGTNWALYRRIGAPTLGWFTNQRAINSQTAVIKSIATEAAAVDAALYGEQRCIGADIVAAIRNGHRGYRQNLR